MAEKIRKAREAKTKVGVEAAEREMSCDHSNDKDNSLIKRHWEKGGLIGRRTFCDDGAVSALAYNWRN